LEQAQGLQSQQSQKQNGLYLLHISLHGLIRANNPEIGRDTDTGGQVRYVLDLVQTLDKSSKIRRVDLLTRKIFDPKISTDYQQYCDKISEKTNLFRLQCGARRYLRKEVLWTHLQEYTDEVLRFIRQQKDLPDVIHAHYADAGLVATRVAKVLGLPVIFTGHSLGRYKLRKLLENGMPRERADKLYNLSKRIEAEEETLENSALIITSTNDEMEKQYKPYDHYNQKLMQVIPPGCDVEKFIVPSNFEALKRVKENLSSFLRYPDRPALLVLARAGKNKNIDGIIRTFGESDLRNKSNLLLLISNRKNIQDMESEQREIYGEMLELIDNYNLYGHVAYPKSHKHNDVPEIYRFTKESGGLFLDFAHYENFGLTLIESAACGLPVVSSAAGGPADILETCKHGVKINPSDYQETAKTIAELLADKTHWQKLSDSGKTIAPVHYKWENHVNTYLSLIEKVISDAPIATIPYRPKRFITAHHVLVCDIDDTLSGDSDAIIKLNEIISSRDDILFGIATGRNLQGALETLEKWNIAEPNFYITSVGTEINYNFSTSKEDLHWKKHINFRWKPERIRKIMQQFPALELQEDEAQSDHKISYYCSSVNAPSEREMKRVLRKNLLQARVIISQNRCLDILPTRASKGHALRYLAWKWQFDASQIITAGDAGNDIDMLRGSTKGIVVGNHSPELEELREERYIYFSKQNHAAGIIDGLHHYGVISYE